MSHHTSITDKPITSVDQDKLKSKRYALALTEFISHSDTPMTVGLQGLTAQPLAKLLGLVDADPLEPDSEAAGETLPIASEAGQ